MCLQPCGEYLWQPQPRPTTRAVTRGRSLPTRLLTPAVPCWLESKSLMQQHVREAMILHQVLWCCAAMTAADGSEGPAEQELVQLFAALADMLGAP